MDAQVEEGLVATGSPVGSVGVAGALLAALGPGGGGRVVRLVGATAAYVEGGLSGLSQGLAGVPLLRIHPDGGRHGSATFAQAVEQYLEMVQQRGALSEVAEGLYEFLLSLGGEGRRERPLEARRDALARLWSELSQSLPVILVVFGGERLAEGERLALEHLGRYFFCDPIAALAPELAPHERAQGALLLVEEAHATAWQVPGASQVDVSACLEHAIQAYLSESTVLRRLVATTGGDLGRLEALIEAMPADVHAFGLYRYRQLAGPQAALVDVLAVAGEPRRAEQVRAVLEHLGHGESFVSSVRALLASGMVQRTVQTGAILLALDDAALAAAICEGLGDAGLTRLHGSWLEALGGAPSVSALARVRHLMGAGRQGEALAPGLEAARELGAQGQSEVATSLLEDLVKGARGPEVVALHEGLVGLYQSLGDHRRALHHCGRLKPWTTAPVARAALANRIARLLLQMGQGAVALEVAEAAGRRLESELAASASGVALAELQVTQAEALYALGRHEACVELLSLATQALEAAEARGATLDAARRLALVTARNLLGKVAIFRGHYEPARALFEHNRAEAGTWGWEREVARAEANLGVVALQCRHYGEARRRLSTAMAMARLPGVLPMAYCLVNLGVADQRQGLFGEALDNYLEGLRASRQSGDEVAYGIAAHNLATLYQDMGAYGRALSLVAHLESERGQGGQPFVQHWMGLVRGQVQLEQGAWLAAIEAFSAVQTAATAQAARVYVREAELRIAQGLMRLGKWSEARARIAAFEVPAEEGEGPQLRGLWGLCRALLALEAGDLGEAGREAAESATLLGSIGQFRDALWARLVQVAALDGEKRTAEALGLAERELRELHARSLNVPEKYRDGYYAIALHRELVQRVQSLAGQIPAEFSAMAQEAKASEPAVADALPPTPPRPRRDARFVAWRQRFEQIIGEDARLYHVFRVVERVAPSETTVLVLGESGTGKELVAEAIHRLSARALKPFVKVNCAAFVEDLLLSELFGHEKGAFTGASSQKLGRFELADGGTLFLDEIGDISPKTQVALLRVLQESTFERVGGTETRRVNVRVVGATNRNLEEMVRRGEFRLDLYYRLKGIVVEMPALRERRQDVPALVRHFASRHADGGQAPRFAPEVLQYLARYRWPGNVRELENFVRSVLLFVDDGRVDMPHLLDFSDFFSAGGMDQALGPIELEAEEVAPNEAIAATGEGEEAAETSVPARTALVGGHYEEPEEALVAQIVADGLSLTKLKKRIELECIKRALIETDGNITRAAELLQMKRPRLSQIVNSNPDLLQHKSQLVG